jgi:hypothetical protein
LPDTGDDRSSNPRTPSGHGFDLYVKILFLVGLAARLRAVLFTDSEMFRSFPTEDGYLMLTVARNMALGLGMSSAAGTIPTNGVQPLAAFVQALCFRLVDGDRAAGIRVLLVVYTLVAALTAYLVYRLGLRLTGPTPDGRSAALLASAVWFTSPAILFHTMNMLETGLYTGCVAGVALCFAWGHAQGPTPWPWLRCLALGALMGLAFWARNDAVFLMLAVGLAHLASPWAGSSLGRRVAETAVMAAASAAVSLPWLLHGYLRFGSVVPVSGQAYLGGGGSAEALRAAAVALFEHVMLLASFEHNALQHVTPVALACGALAALGLGAGIATSLRASRGGSSRGPLLAPALFGAALLAFYAFFFDAPHFMRRHLAPLSPFLALLWAGAAWALWQRIRTTRLATAGPVLLILLLANFFSRDGFLEKGPWHRGAFFRGVDWIEEHVPEEAWVGSFQSGTIGFFHDRTINLDGTLNPEALAAARALRHEAYVVDSPIQFVADWATIVIPWAEANPLVLRHFGWSLRDEERNLAVLRRRAVIVERRP